MNKTKKFPIIKKKKINHKKFMALAKTLREYFEKEQKYSQFSRNENNNNSGFFINP